MNEGAINIGAALFRGFQRGYNMAHAGAEPGILNAPGQGETMLERSINHLGHLNDRASRLEMQLTTRLDTLLGGEPAAPNDEVAGMSPEEVRPKMHQLTYLLEKLEKTLDRNNHLADRLSETL